MDFEKFCATYGEISDKSTGAKIKLKLNGAQRCVFEYLEKCRLSNVPCRLLVLKSRQLGISTLLQYYFTWLLLYHCELETFLSLCHNKQLSKSFVNSMASIYSRVDKEKKPHSVGDNVLEDHKGNHLIFASAKNYNSTRGYNIGIAHLSESAFWHSKTSDWSEEVIRSVMGSVGNRKGTFVVMESTSDGKNNFFYRLWRDSIAGLTSYYPMFLSWNLCEYYAKTLSDRDKEELKSLSPKELSLIDNGISYEQLNWYRSKRKEFQDESSFLREFPSSADESFAMSSNDVFTHDEIEIYSNMAREGHLIDISHGVNGDLISHSGSNFVQWIDIEDVKGIGRFFVVVTIGSSVSETQPNVITCWTIQENDVIKLCLERRYICDLDELIKDSILVARYYKNAMLIVEVNNLNRLGLSSKEYYIRKLKKNYSRLYQQEGNIGYSLSYKRKLRGLFAFRRRLKENKIVDYSELMIDEMKNFVMEDEDVTATIDSHEDVLLCRFILCDLLEIIGPFRPPLDPRTFYRNWYGY